MLNTALAIFTTVIVIGLLAIFTLAGLGFVFVAAIRVFVKLVRYAFAIDKKKEGEK